MAMGSLPFAYLGALLLVNVPVEMLKRMLAVMVLIYLFLSVVNRFPKIKVGIVGLIAGSAAYGFVSGLLGSGNLIKVVVFREMKMTKEVFVSTMAATSVFSNVAKLTAYTKSGLLNESKLWFILSLVVASIGAVLIGQRILRNISVCFFEIGMRIVLAASAIALLI